MDRLRRLMKTTAIRLTVIYTVIFGLLAAAVVAYISLNTSRLLQSQFQAAVDEEVRQISRVVQRRGMRHLVPVVERRSRRPGANLYLVADPSGRIIAGNVRDLDRSQLAEDGWRDRAFQYERFSEEGGGTYRAIARVFTLPGDLKLLVGRDIGDAERFTVIVRRAAVLSLLVLVATALILWLVVGRRALQRIDSVSDQSAKIIAGDLSQRLPVSGSGDEFDRLSDNLNQIIERIEKLNSGVRTMSDSIAHDLKTPLTRLRNSAEAAREIGRKKDRDIELEKIVDDADGLIRTFDALLMISQVESGAQPTKLEPIELSGVIRDVFELFEPMAEEKEVEIRLEIEGVRPVVASRELIAQAVTNLLENALKYGSGHEKPQIELSVKQTSNRVEISVADNGAGIAEGDRENVRGRFVRLDASRNLPGSGLGLSLVNAIVRLHDGLLRLEGNDPGLKAIIELPAAA